MNREAHFCTMCGTPLNNQERYGRVRPVCPACGRIVFFDPKVAVVVWIMQDDKVLLIQRAMNPGKDKWALPAGFVDYDEDPEHAAIREAWEETGLKIEIDQLLEVFPRRDKGLADIVIAYSATIVGGTLQAGDDASDVRWYTRDTIPEMVFYPSITLVKRWCEGEL